MTIDWFILAPAAFFAGMVDAAVGGGGLIQIPALLSTFPQTAIPTLFGTNKLSSIAGTGASLWRYARAVQHSLAPGAARHRGRAARRLARCRRGRLDAARSDAATGRRHDAGCRHLHLPAQESRPARDARTCDPATSGVAPCSAW
jgi:hypothetical protein